MQIPKQKTNRRLKRTVRKTLGTLFLVSAIVVAAIPTEGLRAEEDAVAQATAKVNGKLACSAELTFAIG